MKKKLKHTPLESLKRIAAWNGSTEPSGRITRPAAPNDARLFSNSADALRICAPL